MNPTRSILVFVKYPEPGRVKTRLAQSIGMERAADLYRSWIGQVFARLQDLRSTTRLIGCYDGAPLDRFAPWMALADDWWPQFGENLGQRLASGFAKASESGGPVVAVGTDCLELDTALVQQAFHELSCSNVVFGPAHDGGYYLIGAAKSWPNLFDRIRWSTPHTMSDHLCRCEESQWSTAFLPMRHDLDTLDDWNAYLGRTGQSNDAAVPDPGGRRSDTQ